MRTRIKEINILIDHLQKLRTLRRERAKKEGEVIWYTSAGLQDSNPMAEAFQKDYPFIRISVIRAGSGVLINRILNEARAQKG